MHHRNEFEGFVTKVVKWQEQSQEKDAVAERLARRTSPPFWRVAGRDRDSSWRSQSWC